MKLPNSTYDITYQYSPIRAPLRGYTHHEWHTHFNLDPEETDLLLRMLHEMRRNCRVRQNATGRIEEALARGIEPLTLLHLFFKSISDRNGSATDHG